MDLSKLQKALDDLPKPSEELPKCPRCKERPIHLALVGIEGQICSQCWLQDIVDETLKGQNDG